MIAKILIFNDWNELEREIMDFKEGTNIQTISENEYYPINFSFFQDIFNDDTDLDDLVDKYNKNCNNYELKLKITSKKRKWVIEIPHKIIYNYIIAQVNSICEIINDILKNDEGINSVILVGGYCSNEVLISEIKKKLLT